MAKFVHKALSLNNIYINALRTNALREKASNCTDEVNRECFLANYAKGGHSRNFSSTYDSQYTVYACIVCM